ncbi:MAG: hypothetical protein WC538_21780 [Thermoanaerobaculia bacterium]|jgi:anaerobic selenocysteine-containing dehydrogenase
MKFEVTRRDVMRFAGGAVVGTALSPLPWSLTDDLAIWTQNWGWIPKPPRGERSTRTVVCTLCPSACAIEAQCVGKSPVALRAANPPHGLCPSGLTGHHLPWHPARITRPLRIARGDARPATMPLDAVVRETAKALSSTRAGVGSTVVLDMRPGRSGSWAWQRLLGGIAGASVVAAPGLEGSSFDAFDTLLGSGAKPATLDLAEARTILSFGAPIAEGWGRLRDTCRGEVTLIQVEPMRSRSAEIADHWLPARPGSEGALALGIANILIAEQRVDPRALESIDDYAAYCKLVANYPLARVSAITGLAPDDIAAAASELASSGPAIVVAGEQPGGGALPLQSRIAILGLNALLGGTGRVVDRVETPAPRDGEPLAPVARLESIPDRSITLLLVDASAGDIAFPWQLVERKLAKSGSLVVALSPFLAGTARHADLVVPTAPYLEAIQELPSTRDEAAPALSISAPILPAREGSVDPVAFVRLIADAARIDLGSDWKSSEELSHERVARIHAAGTGSVTKPSGNERALVSSFGSPDELWAALEDGGRWSGDRAAVTTARRLTLATGLAGLSDEAPEASSRSERVLKLVPRASRDTTLTAVVSPVLSKLYQESELRRSPGRAAINPRTATSLGLGHARTARLLTAAGSLHVALSLDEGVMPGVVELAVAPDPVALGHKTRPGDRAALELFTPAEDGSWCSVDAELMEG